MNQITNVKIIKDPILKWIIKNPFKFYVRIAGFTFYLVSISNFITTVLGIHDNDKQRRKLLMQYNQGYFTMLLGKSCYYALLWPSFYFTAFRNPKEAFILGSNIDEIKVVMTSKIDINSTNE